MLWVEQRRVKKTEMLILRQTIMTVLHFSPGSGGSQFQRWRMTLASTRICRHSASGCCFSI
uniref:Uncharacterized protein n=1 Tax=Anguilla anguilla TaxID=7936 RepID=A0A0E9PXZ9_ANGAN